MEKERMIPSSKIKVRKSGFGHFFDLDGNVPARCDLVILCGNKGGGHVPYRCLLPHQVYKKDLQETFDEENFEAIFAIPVQSDHAFVIAYQNKYGKQRWDKPENHVKDYETDDILVAYKIGKITLEEATYLLRRKYPIKQSK